MKRVLMFGLFLWWLTPLPAAEVGRTLMVNTNGGLLSPTNFFNTNAHRIYRGLTNAGYTFGSGSGVGVTSTGGIISTTNSGVVSLSLYTAPTISSFVNNQVSVEQGATVTSTVLDWVLAGGTITSQSINQGVGSLATGLRTATHTSSYTTNRTYTLTVSDGTTTPTANTTVTFYQKAYWGASANTTLNDAQVIALSSEFATGRTRSKSVVTANSYIYFAYPASFGAAAFVVDGFADEGWTLVTRAFVNASGYSSSYNIYRHTLLTSGTYAVTVN